MAKDFAKKFYNSKRWHSCRNAFFNSKHGLCERCDGVGKIVHHTVYLTPENINDPMVSLNHELLELLCQDCHNLEHHGNSESVIRDGLMFDEEGNLVKV